MTPADARLEARALGGPVVAAAQEGIQAQSTEYRAGRGTALSIRFRMLERRHVNDVMCHVLQPWRFNSRGWTKSLDGSGKVPAVKTLDVAHLH